MRLVLLSLRPAARRTAWIMSGSSLHCSGPRPPMLSDMAFRTPWAKGLNLADSFVSAIMRMVSLRLTVSLRSSSSRHTVRTLRSMS